ncbi:tRNA dimethylallyltransferase 9 [Striga asiatica]|uniref:tRNA dimethylallyltransferase 9 n=1 Tax=Striga asiatica TaxID=4170 RepID=A0A5A7PW74_STRAF|nr:tRNA dimethylallyltransferase 9 [Striga asiatica]
MGPASHSCFFSSSNVASFPSKDQLFSSAIFPPIPTSGETLSFSVAMEIEGAIKQGEEVLKMVILLYMRIKDRRLISGKLTHDDGILSEANWLLDLNLMPNSNSTTRAIGYRQSTNVLLMSREQGGWSYAQVI